MTENEKLQMFEDQTIRTAWDEKKRRMVFFGCGCSGGADRANRC